MGTLNFTPVAKLALDLRDKFNIKTLIETGTYQGQSTSWAAKHFENVISLDIRADYQAQGIENCKEFNNIQFLIGDTRHVLPPLVAALTEPAMFWLDAHSVKDMFGPFDDCPILEELDIINRSPHKHFVLIDDAHCFKPPVPHDAKVWPEIDKLEEKAHEGGYLMWEAHDVIVIVPSSATAEARTFTGTETAEGNSIRAVISMGTLKRRLHPNLMPTKFNCSARAYQGDFHPVKLAPVERPKLVTELVNTIYGDMLVPTFDTNQTPALRGGEALDRENIGTLIDLIQHGKPGAVVLDIGANVGTFSFALRPHCAAIHAFEAQRIIFNMLCGSVAINGWSNVFCYNVAMTDTYSKIKVPQFDYTKKLSFGSIEFGPTQKEELDQERQDETLKREFVEGCPLDSFLFARVDLIKVDIEGMELQFLTGANQTIHMHHPILFIEHTKVEKDELRRRLVDLGYKVTDTGNDFLCIPE
jgi:FkbM family methyltransferase